MMPSRSKVEAANLCPTQFLRTTGDFEVEVLLLSEMRGPASVAQRCTARRRRAASYA